MEYNEIAPCSTLKPFIHAFWELKGDDSDNQWERIFPDGCSGLIFNMGDTCVTDNGKVKIDFGKTYVAGTMTSFKDSLIDSSTHLIGVCLKPAVLSDFYNFVPQSEIINQTVLLEDSRSFDIDKIIKSSTEYLNIFFLNRLQHRNGYLKSVIEHIHAAKGKLSIDAIAKKSFTTIRDLERKFKVEIGISPKEYSRIVRFQNALAKIADTKRERSLSDIAVECGYYDHTHLTNEFKRNTGHVPSQF